MSGIGPIGVDRVMAMRAQILERNAALAKANAASGAAPAAPADGAQPTSFASTFENAIKSVSEQQNKATALSEQYERGETVDIAKVMLARQQASVGFEATMQVRNKLLAAYKDIMSMPV